MKTVVLLLLCAVVAMSSASFLGAGIYNPLLYKSGGLGLGYGGFGLGYGGLGLGYGGLGLGYGGYGLGGLGFGGYGLGGLGFGGYGLGLGFGKLGLLGGFKGLYY